MDKLERNKPDAFFNVRRLNCITLVAIAAGFASTNLMAGGFQLSEHTVTGLGRALAGSGVAGDDLSDMYANPAGLMLAGDGRRMQFGLAGLDINGGFTNEGSTQQLLTESGFVTIPSRGPDSDAADSAAIPNLYYVSPDLGSFRYGFSVTSPFGLRTDYDTDWVGRYHALVSELKTVDLNLAGAWSVSDSLSLGAGINVQTAEAELSRAIFQGPTAPDGRSTLKGDNVGVGYSFGGLLELGSGTRLGLGFRSKVKQALDGDLTITGTPRDAVIGASASVDLPETIYLSGYHEINSTWALLGTLRWTNWSRFVELRTRFDNNVLPDDVTEENWEDSVSASIGVQYRVRDGLTLRAGYEKDESPIPNESLRTPRIPGADRDWFTVGASFNTSDKLTIDLSLARLNVDEARLQNSINLVGSAPGAFTDNLSGSYSDSSVNILAVQLQYAF